MVDTLAHAAKQIDDPDAVIAIVNLMTVVQDTFAEFLKPGPEKSDPGRPLPVLQKYCIGVAAQRSSLQHMRQDFNDYASVRPTDASALCTQGMQQIDTLDFPSPLREVRQHISHSGAKAAVVNVIF